MSHSDSIYLSYSRYETEFALKLATDLRNAGINIWCDRLRVAPGDELLPTLKNAISNAHALICVVSANYLRAQYARHEWEHARRKGKQLLPIHLTSLDGMKVPVELAMHRAIDFQDWREESSYEAALSRLLRLFGTISEHRVPSRKDQYLNRLIANVEIQIARSETLDPPDQENSPTARARLRPLSPLEPVWGRVGDVHVLRTALGASPMGAVLPLHQAIQATPRFVLTGGAGGGKSSVLARRALDLAFAHRADPEHVPMPLWLDLAEMQPGETLESFIRRVWPLESDALEEIGAGRAALVLDGVNEAPDAELAVSEVRALLQGPCAPPLVAIGVRSPNLAAQLESGLPIFELLPLNDAHIRDITQAHLGAAAGPLLEQLAPAESRADTPLLNLARNPAYLNGLIFLYRSSPQNALPETVGALYKRVLPSSWVWWRLAQAPIGMPYRELVPMLGKLAVHLLDAGQMTIPVDDAAMVLLDPSVQALKAASNLNVVRVDAGAARFSHALLRDFYAAMHLQPIDLAMRVPAPRFSAEGGRLQNAYDHVLEMLSGFMLAADAYVRTVCEIDPYLAAQCVASGAHVSASVIEEVLDALLLEAGDNGRQPAVRAALSALGSARLRPLLRERMQQGGDVQRQAAVWAIKEMTVPLPIALLKALKDWDWTPNEQAAQVLQQAAAQPETLDALINILDDSDPARRLGAAWALGVLGDRAALPALRISLKDSQARVRDMAAKAVRQIEQRAAPPPAPQPAVRRIAAPAPPAAVMPDSPRPAAALSASTAPASTAPAPAAAALSSEAQSIADLLRQLSDPKWERRQQAVRALGLLGREESVMPLLETLQDASEQVRYSVVRVLGTLAGPNVASGLLGALADRSLYVATAAREELGRMGSVALPGLMAIAREAGTPVAVRALAIEALGMIADPQSVEVLIPALTDDRETPTGVRVCDLAAAALDLIDSDEARTELEDWSQEQQQTQEIDSVEYLPADVGANRFSAEAAQPADAEHDETDAAPEETIRQMLDEMRVSDTHEQHEAAKRLRHYARSLRGTLDDNRAVYALADALRDANYVVRWASVEALAWLQDDSALPILHEALHDRHFTVRLAAIRALQEINESSAVWALLECLRDDNRLVREKAAEALGRLGGPDIALRLAEALQDSDVFVRRAAVVSLGAIGSREVSVQLLCALDDEELLVRWAAVEALGKLGEPAAVDSLVEWLNDDHQPGWDKRRACDVALHALENIPGPEAAAALRRWRARTSPAR